MEQLAVLGSEPTCETHARHGAPGEVFAVRSSALRERHQRRGAGQALARALAEAVSKPVAEASWFTANRDARVRATMVADPSAPAALDALTAPPRIGNVVVDHGQTACNEPGAISFPSSGLVPQ